MSSCCCPEQPVDATAHPCPDSGSIGLAVDRQTIKALLTEQALSQLTASEYRFCPDADCDVVYFASDGMRFGTDDLRVAVWQKRPFGDRLVCYCFGESEASIRADFESCGRSSAVDRVRGHIAAGRCACEVRNPRGTCCLGDVISAVIRVESSVATAPRSVVEQDPRRSAR